MSWTYSQSTGLLSAADNSYSSTGYSGHGEGRNNPDMQNVSNVGPIPQGTYTVGKPYNDPEKGPCVMRLTPVAGDEMYGRSGFLMHGNNKKNDASEGCIVTGPVTRVKVSTSEDRTLVVTA